MALTKKYVASLIVGWGCRIFPFASIWFVDCFTTIAFCGRFYCCKEIEANQPSVIRVVCIALVLILTFGFLFSGLFNYV